MQTTPNRSYPVPETPEGLFSELATTLLAIDADVNALTSAAVFNVFAYGIVGSAHGGAPPADESVAFLALLDIVYAAGGGTIEFNKRKYRFDSKWLIPNDGGATPRQPTIRIVGQGALFNGQGGAPNGGTIIDLRYQGTPAKIDTRGLGLLAIGDLTLADGGSANSTAFIQTTNTTLGVVGQLGFYGTTPNTPTQDCFVLGGTVPGDSDGTENSPFQGYGTVIKNCYANRIQRLVYGRTYCNAVVIRDNTGWTQNGGIAFVEFLADASNADTGNVIVGNLIEINNYTYGMKFGGPSIGNNIGPNGFFDDTATTQAIYRFETDAQYNMVVDGFRSDAIPLVSETGSSVGTTTILTSHQSQPSVFPQPLVGHTITTKNNLTAYAIETSVGDGAFQEFFKDGAGFYKWQFYVTPAGGSAEAIAEFFRISANDHRFQLHGAVTSYIKADADLGIQPADGSTLILGPPSAPNQVLISAAGTTISNLRATVLTAGSTPVTLTDAAGMILSAALNTVGVAQGGTGATTAANARANLGATTVGGNLFTATNPSAISFPKVAADNTVSFRTPAQVLTDIGAQPLDGNLTTIASLTATTNNFIMSVASAWASRTPAQVKTTLSLDSVENTPLSTWAGSANITTLGTIANATLQVNGSYTNALNPAGFHARGNIAGIAFEDSSAAGNHRNFAILNSYASPGLLQINYSGSGGGNPTSVAFTLDAITGNICIGGPAPAASALLELSSNIGAFLPTRMTTTERDALTAVDGMILYNTTTGALNYRKAGAWVAI